MARITHISCPEGSIYTDITKERIDVPTQDRLDKLRDRAKKLGIQYCYIGQLTVHSFRTDDGRTWDTINGWRSYGE